MNMLPFQYSWIEYGILGIQSSYSQAQMNADSAGHMESYLD